MKITAQEEYGLRILIRIAACRDTNVFDGSRIHVGDVPTRHDMRL